MFHGQKKIKREILVWNILSSSILKIFQNSVVFLKIFAAAWVFVILVAIAVRLVLKQYYIYDLPDWAMDVIWTLAYAFTFLSILNYVVDKRYPEFNLQNKAQIFWLFIVLIISVFFMTGLDLSSFLIRQYFINNYIHLDFIESNLLYFLVIMKYTTLFFKGLVLIAGYAAAIFIVFRHRITFIKYFQLIRMNIFRIILLVLIVSISLHVLSLFYYYVLLDIMQYQPSIYQPYMQTHEISYTMIRNNLFFIISDFVVLVWTASVAAVFYQAITLPSASAQKTDDSAQGPD